MKGKSWKTMGVVVEPTCSDRPARFLAAWVCKRWGWALGAGRHWCWALVLGGCWRWAALPLSAATGRRCSLALLASAFNCWHVPAPAGGMRHNSSRNNQPATD